MEDAEKTKVQLIQEMVALRQQIARLKAERTMPSEAHVQGEDVHKALLQAILETVVDCIITIDEQGRIESFNPAVECLFGYRAAEVVGHNIAMLMPSLYREEHYGYLRQYLQRGEKWIIGTGREVVGQRRDGSTFPCELAVGEGRLGDRRVFTAIVRDITERKRTEVALRRMEHLAMLGRLAAGVSHELRNPLGVIFLHMDILQEELRQPSPDSQAQLAESMVQIRIELARMHELVQDYLSLARLVSLHWEEADLGTFVRVCAQEMEEQVVSRGITLLFEGLESLGVVVFHLNTFRRALVNLLQNALDAMPKGGRLTLRGRRTASRVHLEISDTGVGIPEDELPLIFEPLHTTKPNGTGLGLYLVREIMAAHAGHIAVQSAPGQGTTFTITLPRDRGKSEPQVAPFRSPASELDTADNDPYHIRTLCVSPR
jgi:two-component system sensor kinase FixL